MGVKITILDVGPDEEEEIIIKCRVLDEETRKLLNRFKQGRDKLKAYKKGEITLIDAAEVFYFESVDQKVFACCAKEVYEIKMRLYELEEALPEEDFIRAGKSSILNLNKIKSLTPAFSGRFEALLQNGEKAIISRQYVGTLKRKLGL